MAYGELSWWPCDMKCHFQMTIVTSTSSQSEEWSIEFMFARYFFMGKLPDRLFRGGLLKTSGAI